MAQLYELTCWHCGQPFEYTPPDLPVYKDKPVSFFQGYTICENCKPCFPGRGPCGIPGHV